jgi:flagellar basal body-associated protein FliL
MVEREEDTQNEAQVEAAPSGKRKRIVALGVILGVMGIEALVIFVLVKSYVVPPPQLAQAGQFAGLDSNAGQKAPQMAEVEVASVRALNEKSPRPVIYDLSVYAVVPAKQQASFQGVIERRKQTIRDRFVTIIRGADPSYFREADLLSLRSQLKTALSKVAGENVEIHEVLVPSIIPYTAG